MLSLESPRSGGGEADSRPEACGLRDKKNVAGAAVRGSRDGEGGSKEGFWEKEGKSGAGRMIAEHQAAYMGEWNDKWGDLCSLHGDHVILRM